MSAQSPPPPAGLGRPPGGRGPGGRTTGHLWPGLGPGSRGGASGVPQPPGRDRRGPAADPRRSIGVAVGRQRMTRRPSRRPRPPPPPTPSTWRPTGADPAGSLKGFQTSARRQFRRRPRSRTRHVEGGTRPDTGAGRPPLPARPTPGSCLAGAAGGGGAAAPRQAAAGRTARAGGAGGVGARAIGLWGPVAR